MYLNVTQVSPVFQGKIRVQTAEVLKNGKVVDKVNDFPIDVKDIKSIDSVRVDARAFARELGLPNMRQVISSLKESVDRACDKVSFITLYNNMKYKIGVAKDKVLEAYSSVLNNDSEVIL